MSHAYRLLAECISTSQVTLFSNSFNILIWYVYLLRHTSRPFSLAPSHRARYADVSTQYPSPFPEGRTNHYTQRPLNLLSTSYVPSYRRAHADPLTSSASRFTLSLLIVAAQRLVLDLRKVTDEHDEVSTTRVGREVERAVQALPRSRSASPIVFVDLEALVGDGRGTARARARSRGAALELTALRGGGRDRDRTVRT